MSTEKERLQSETYAQYLEKTHRLGRIFTSAVLIRFYHEQNRNVILLAEKEDVKYDSDRYIWVSVGTLNVLTQINNCLNIQLRNLLMLLAMVCR